MSNDKIFICESCKGILKELSLYRWDDKSTSEKDRVIKEHDHACDDMRYFVNTVAGNKLLRGLIKKGGSAND
jgi:hypothetical protein